MMRVQNENKKVKEEYCKSSTKDGIRIQKNKARFVTLVLL